MVGRAEEAAAEDWVTAERTQNRSKFSSCENEIPAHKVFVDATQHLFLFQSFHIIIIAMIPSGRGYMQGSEVTGGCLRDFRRVLVASTASFCASTFDLRVANVSTGSGKTNDAIVTPTCSPSARLILVEEEWGTPLGLGSVDPRLGDFLE